MMKSLAVESLSDGAGALVTGIDASAPLGSDERRRLYDLYLKFGLLLLRDQHLRPEQHIAFARLFGALDIHPIEQVRLDGYPELIELSNRLNPPKRPGEEDSIVGQIPWHSDLFYTVRPSRGAVLYAREVPPEGGETAFVDTAVAYDRLSETMKRRIDRLEVLHNARIEQTAVQLERPEPFSPAERKDSKRRGHAYADAEEFSSSRFPDVVHPLIVTHPETGRKALNTSPSSARRILGLPEDEAVNLLSDLAAHATMPRHVYHHSWRAGDIVIWDNWRTMHMATGYKAKYLRVMHRATLRAEFEMGRLAA